MFGTDIGSVKRTRSLVGENTAGVTGVDADTAEAAEKRERRYRQRREEESPVRLGSLHTVARKSPRDAYRG